MHDQTMELRPASVTFPSISPLVSPKTSLLEEDILSGGRARMPKPKYCPGDPPSISKTGIPSLHQPKKSHYVRSPRAPRPDVHAFLLPPPYTAKPTPFHAVPNNTPSTTPSLAPLGSSSNTSSDDSSATLITPDAFSDMCSRSRSRVGLGLEGLEKGGGGVFNGLGRLSDGLRVSNSSCGEKNLRRSSYPPCASQGKVQSRPASAQPKKRHDVFFSHAQQSNTALSPTSFPARAPTTEVQTHQGDDAESPTPEHGIE